MKNYIISLPLTLFSGGLCNYFFALSVFFIIFVEKSIVTSYEKNLFQFIIIIFFIIDRFRFCTNEKINF